MVATLNLASKLIGPSLAAEGKFLVAGRSLQSANVRVISSDNLLVYVCNTGKTIETLINFTVTYIVCYR